MATAHPVNQQQERKEHLPAERQRSVGTTIKKLD